MTHSVKAHVIVHVEAKTKEQHVYDIIMARLVGGKQPDVEDKCTARETMDHTNVAQQ